MRISRWSAVALTMLAITTIACGQPKSDGGSSRTEDPPSVASPVESTPGQKAKASPTGPASTGTVQVTFRGTNGAERVRCSGINTEFAVSAYGGPIVWTAQARDREPTKWPYEGSAVSSVVLQPATGSLGTGQRAVIRVNGSFTGSAFFVAVSAPNSAGQGWNTVKFSCS